nr:alkaline phosphatase family protein [Sphingobium algorifonticola]
MPAPRPKLIVTIAVDQLSGDLFDEYRPHFTGGLARLAQGVVFPRGYQSHAATETCPGHSTILTGSRPSRTGIIANSYFDLSTARADKAIYCAEDETQPGSSSENYVASPVHLKVPTLGDRMKRANPAARVVSVAGKDRAAIMMGGPTADQTWWWGGKSFVSYKGIAETPLVAQVNAGIAKLIGQDRPPMELPDYCAPKAIAIDVGNGKSVGAGQFARAAGDLRAFNISPEKDASTLVLAAALIESLGLGKQTQTDSIAIGLSATDHVGHTYGTEGGEMCLQLSAVDRELGAFFDRLDKSGIDYAVVLTADHGGHDMPERNRAHGAPDAQRVDAALLPVTLNQRLSAQLGLPAPLLYADGPFGDFYVSRALTPDQRAKVQAAAVSMIRAHPQVQAVFTAQDLAATPSPSGPPENWSLAQIARASFFPGRSGDFLVLLKPRVTPIADGSRGSVATHGSPWDYDRRVPILFWRKGITPFEQPLGVETVDIMPTLAAQIGLAVPKGEIDGRCLDLDVTAGDSCAGQ